MGYDVLSMNSTNLPRVKWVIRNISMMQARRWLVSVLRMSQAEEIEEFMREALIDAGLGRVVPSYEGTRSLTPVRRAARVRRAAAAFHRRVAAARRADQRSAR